MTPDAVLRNVEMLGRIFDTFGLAQLRPEAALMFPKPQIRHLRTRLSPQMWCTRPSDERVVGTAKTATA